MDSVSSSNTLGRYQILREIARSNDIVYEATDPTIGRRVALKELQLPGNLAGAQRRERIERFYREAKAAGSLSHPNIVTIHEVGEERGRHFIAMEFLDGQSLREVLQIQNVLSIGDVVRVATAVAEALDYAHQHGVIHRDVKPDNVYLLTDGRIKLTDFGIARLMFEANLTADGQVFGTPSYMSPEQVAGKGIDPRSDIFSLGVMVYEMIAGRKPFPGDSVVTITYNIMHMEPGLLHAVPTGFQAAVQRALAKDPGQRFRTAGEFVAELRRAMAAGGAAASRPVSAGTPVTGQVAPGAAPGVPGGAAGLPSSNGARRSSPTSATGLFMDALAGLKPEDWWLPRRRRRPRAAISPETRTWLGAVLLAIIGGAVLLFLVWSTMQAYREWQAQQRRQSAVIRAQQAWAAYRGGQFEQAIAGFEEAAKLDPNSDVGRDARKNGARAAATYAQKQQGLGNTRIAESWYERAINIDPEYAEGCSLLAASLRRRGEEGRAEYYYQRALRLAEAQVQQPQRPAAEREEAQRTLEVVQYSYGALLVDRGQLAYNAGRYPDAEQAWRQAIQVAPGTAIAQTAQDRLQQIPAVPGRQP